MINLTGRGSQILPEQKVVFNQWLEEFKPKVIVEVGCWLGESTSVWGNWAANNGAVVFAVDHWRDNFDTGLLITDVQGGVFNQFITNLNEMGLNRNVFPVVGDSAESAKYFADGFADLIFIDACHLYSRVSKDIDAWLPKVRKGGLLCGHDYEGTTYNPNYIENDFMENRHNGVIKAVTEKFGNISPACFMWRHDV